MKAIGESQKIALNADANHAVPLNTLYKSCSTSEHTLQISAHKAPNNTLQQTFSLMYSNNGKG